MIEQLKPERVRIKRHNNDSMVGVITHALHQDITDKAGNVVGQGAMLGIGFRDDRGFNLYTQMGDIQPLEETQ